MLTYISFFRLAPDRCTNVRGSVEGNKNGVFGLLSAKSILTPLLQKDGGQHLPALILLLPYMCLFCLKVQNAFPVDQCQILSQLSPPTTLCGLVLPWQFPCKTICPHPVLMWVRTATSFPLTLYTEVTAYSMSSHQYLGAPSCPLIVLYFVAELTTYLGSEQYPNTMKPGLCFIDSITA